MIITLNLKKFNGNRENHADLFRGILDHRHQILLLKNKKLCPNFNLLN